jgi:hypothetical protein
MIENNLEGNYLDYLFWRKARVENKSDKVMENFKFALRNCVEYFSPQYRMDEEDCLPDTIDQYVCLILLVIVKNNSAIRGFGSYGA